MPHLTIDISVAMFEAIKRYRQNQHARGNKITNTDIVTGALRQAGFEREDVLDALANGEVPEIDIRRRTPAKQRPIGDRVREYLKGHGCTRLLKLSRNLHVHVDEIKRAVKEMMTAREAHLKPFERPRYVHVNAVCKCGLALPVNTEEIEEKND